MLEKIKLLWMAIRPELIRFLKAAIKIGIDTLLPIALEAVVNAEVKGRAQGWSGSQKFDYAASEVKSKVPAAAIGQIMSAVQNAWVIKEAEGWKD